MLAGLWMVRRLKKDVLAQLPPLRRVVARLEDLRETKKRRRGGDDGADAGDDDDDDGAPAAADGASSEFHAAGRAKAVEPLDVVDG